MRKRAFVRLERCVECVGGGVGVGLDGGGAAGLGGDVVIDGAGLGGGGYG